MKCVSKFLCGAIIVAEFSVACAPVQAAEARISVQIVDQRNPKESTGSMGAISQSSCEFFVTRFSDKNMPRSRLDYLKGALELSGKSSLNGKTIVVERYIFNLNESTRYGNQMRRSTWGVLASQGYYTNLNQVKVPQPKCSKDRTKEGWFSPEEVSNEHPPLIADLEIELDGKDFVSHKVISPRDIFDKLRKEEKMELRQTLMRMIESDIVQKIGA